MTHYINACATVTFSTLSTYQLVNVQLRTSTFLRTLKWFHRLVYGFLHFRPNAHPQELINIGAVNPVRQENKYQVILGVNPETGACKTGMAKG